MARRSRRSQRHVAPYGSAPSADGRSSSPSHELLARRAPHDRAHPAGSGARVVVDRVVPSPDRRDDPDFHLRGPFFWGLAFDQRAFGPRRLVVAGADADGQLLELVHTLRTDPVEVAFSFCLRTLGAAVETAVAYCDEPVDQAATRSELDAVVERLKDVRRHADDGFGIHLVDWLACDDQAVRSSHLLADPHVDPWTRP